MLRRRKRTTLAASNQIGSAIIGMNTTPKSNTTAATNPSQPSHFGKMPVRMITQPVAWHALVLSLWTAGLMAIVNAVMGTLTAYVLVRYSFPGKRLLNGLIDLPFAIPTLVTGVMLVVLYGPQRALGAWFDQNLGLKIIFAPPGLVLVIWTVSPSRVPE